MVGATAETVHFRHIRQLAAAVAAEINLKRLAQHNLEVLAAVVAQTLQQFILARLEQQGKAILAAHLFMFILALAAVGKEPLAVLEIQVMAVLAALEAKIA